MLIEFIHSITLLFTLALLHSLIIHKLENSQIKEQFASGLLFGIIAVVAMLTPVQLSQGVIFDPRSIIISLSWIFSGPIAAVISAIIAITYRSWLGGAGTFTGVLVISLCAMMGGIYCFLNKKYKFSSTTWHFLIYGLLVHIVVLICFFIFLPTDLAKKVIIPFLVLFPLATFFTAFILIKIKKQLGIEKKLHNQSEKILYQAYYDELTTLPNRTLFIDRLNQSIKQLHRNHKQMAVLFIDLDRFKSINESLGHETGDLMLIEIASRLQHSVRDTDSISRFGGDEFGILIDNISNVNIINDIIENIITHISQVFEINEHQLYITASIGISLYPLDGETPNELLRNADSAMYKAKDEGRNTYQYYTKEMTSKAFEHILMESNLRQALENHEFILNYQPQVLAQDGHIFGMEALVRWQHPELGMISPAKFIPLAEETGLIIPLGEEIFNIATKQIVKWMENSSIKYRMAINLSVKQLQQQNIVAKLTDILKANQCSPEWIELEVTEGYVMKNPELAINTLQHFSDMGVEMAIDDFGTGYSSLSYLKRLPINKLKIDQSFVRDLSIGEDDKAIVESIIYLSKAMNLKVIAEGVETLKQKDFLQKQGCNEVQGYLYSKPVPADEMTNLLSTKIIKI